jgi:hypothetical protein
MFGFASKQTWARLTLRDLDLLAIPTSDLLRPSKAAENDVDGGMGHPHPGPDDPHQAQEGQGS